jgi:tetratricopeptide (TPR) repeat protein
MNKSWTLLSIATLLFLGSAVQEPPSVKSLTTQTGDPVTIVLTILTSVLTSAGLSVLLTYWLNSRKARHRKLEELFQYVQSFGMHFTERVKPYIKPLTGDGMTPEQEAEYTTLTSGGSTPAQEELNEAQECQKLVNLYFYFSKIPCNFAVFMRCHKTADDKLNSGKASKGDVHDDLEHFHEAQRALEASMASALIGRFRAAKVRKDVPRVLARRLGVVVLNNQGDILRDQGDPAGALKRYRRALAIAENLARQVPSNAAWQRDLAYAYWQAAQVLAKMKPRSESKAYEMLKKARDILEPYALTGLQKTWLNSINKNLNERR